MSAVLILSLSACVRTKELTFRPITGADIFIKDGLICMTPDYFQHVLEAKIEESVP